MKSVFRDWVFYRLAKKAVLLFRAVVFFFPRVSRLLKTMGRMPPLKQHMTKSVLIEGWSCAYRCLCISVHSLMSLKLSNRNFPTFKISSLFQKCPVLMGLKHIEGEQIVENESKKWSLKQLFWQSLASTVFLILKLFFLKWQGNKYYGSFQWDL